MGRGLSELQTTILGLALVGMRRPPRMVTSSIGTYDANAHRPHVEVEEVLTESYGLTREQRRVGYQRRTFRQTIEYDRAAAAVSRAFKRLIDRGLLVARHERRRKYPSGYDLTERGMELAQSLTVKNSAPTGNS